MGALQAISHSPHNTNLALGCSASVNCSHSGGTVEHFILLQHCVLAGGSHYCLCLVVLTPQCLCLPSAAPPAGGSHQLQRRRWEPEGAILCSQQKLGYLLSRGHPASPARSAENYRLTSPPQGTHFSLLSVRKSTSTKPVASITLRPCMQRSSLVYDHFLGSAAHQPAGQLMNPGCAARIFHLVGTHPEGTDAVAHQAPAPWGRAGFGPCSP